MSDATPAPAPVTLPSPAPLADALSREFAIARTARRLRDRLLGLALDRLADPPAIWTTEQRNLGVASPPHLDGLLAVHADCEAATLAGVRARAKAERAMPALRAAREAGRLHETGYRLLCVKTTPDTLGEWLAEAPPPSDRAACAAYHQLLAAALAPLELPSPLPDGPPERYGETPDDVRFRIDALAEQPGSVPVALHLTVAFTAEQHDSWWHAKRKIRGSTHETPSSGATLRALLDFFGSPEVVATTGPPATLAEITPGRRRFICPITGRQALSTNAARIEVEPIQPALDEAGQPTAAGLRTPRVLVRDAVGRSLRWTRTQLRRAFPEVFFDPAHETPEQLARCVRALLGYPAGTPATVPCPPVPARFDPGRPEPISEDAVPPDVLAALDPDADTLPPLSPVETRAVTVSTARIDGELHYREVAALAAMHEAEGEGRVPAGSMATACARMAISGRSRQEALALWRRLQVLPALAAAFRAGLAYGKVRVLAGVATPATVEAWIAFARLRRRFVIEAYASVANPGDLPPAVPDGLAPTLPIGSRVPETIHADLSPEQQATLARLREWLEPVLGTTPGDGTLFSTIAGWYVVARSSKKKQRDVIVYQRSPGARLPLELRRPDSTGPLPSTLNSRLSTVLPSEVFPWAFATGALPATEWPLPLITDPDHVPRPYREAIEDRDGFRCTATGCQHDLVIQYNHGVGRRYGQKADLATDQHVDGPCNEGHANKQLFIVNRPDGGTWCWDAGDRLIGATTPIARQLDAPLVAHLMALARKALAAAVARPDSGLWTPDFRAARHRHRPGRPPRPSPTRPDGRPPGPDRFDIIAAARSARPGPGPLPGPGWGRGGRRR